jgi:hypothetical protein
MSPPVGRLPAPACRRSAGRLPAPASTWMPPAAASMWLLPVKVGVGAVGNRVRDGGAFEELPPRWRLKHHSLPCFLRLRCRGPRGSYQHQRTRGCRSSGFQVPATGVGVGAGPLVAITSWRLPVAEVPSIRGRGPRRKPPVTRPVDADSGIVHWPPEPVLLIRALP